MNAAYRARLQALLAEAIEKVINQEVEEGAPLPVWGHATFHHMAIAAINVVEAVEDVESYLGAQLPDDIRTDLGI